MSRAELTGFMRLSSIKLKRNNKSKSRTKRSKSGGGVLLSGQMKGRVEQSLIKKMAAINWLSAAGSRAGSGLLHEPARL